MFDAAFRAHERHRLIGGELPRLVQILETAQGSPGAEEPGHVLLAEVHVLRGDPHDDLVHPGLGLPAGEDLR